MQMMPRVKAAKARANFNFGSHTGTLFGDIEPAGRVQYAWLLVVYDKATKQPVFMVSSEVNSMATMMGGGSHYLCVFDENGRGNLGGSDDWADEEPFTARALGVVYEKLPALANSKASDRSADSQNREST